MKKTVYIITIMMMFAAFAAAQNDWKERKDMRQKRDWDDKRERGGMERGGDRGGVDRKHGGGMHGGIIDRFVNNPHIAEKMGLSEEQVAKLKNIAETSKKRQEELMEAMKEAGKKQAEIMSKDDVDRAELKAAFEELTRIRAEMGWIKTEELLALKELLNKEQREKIRGMMQNMQHRQKGGMERDGERGGERGGMDREEMRRKWEERRGGEDQRRPPRRDGDGMDRDGDGMFKM